LIFLLEQFVKEPSTRGNWKHEARLAHQETDLKVADAVLQKAGIRSETIRAYLRSQGQDDSAAKEIERVLTPFLSSHKNQDLTRLYGENGSKMARDFLEIAKRFQFKMYVDCHDDPSTQSVHRNLIEQVVLKRKFFERLPETEYPFDGTTLARTLKNEYATRTGDHSETRSLNDMQAALGAECVRNVKTKLHVQAKSRMLLHIERPHSLDSLLLDERRVSGPSKNPVFEETFSIADEVTLKTIIKVFDRRDPATAESKKKEFENETRAIRYFERTGLVDSMWFTWGKDDGISIIAMNHLGGDNLLNVMERETPQLRYELAKDVVKMAAKFHAYGPANLARDTSQTPRERTKAFAGRITGENAFFFPHIIRLLKSQHVSINEPAGIERKIAEGLEPVIKFLAEETAYDGTYCDVNWRNWYVKEEEGHYQIYAKRDFGTLKTVPVQVDLATLFVVGDYVRDKRGELYDLFFKTYNDEVDSVNALVRKRNKNARHFLMTQITQDLRKVKDGNYHISPGTLERCYNHLRYNTTEKDFSLKETLTKLESEFKEDEDARGYVQDLQIYMESMKLMRKQFRNPEQFKRVAKAAEVKRGLVMAGFFAECALERGLNAEDLHHIKTSYNNALRALDEIAQGPEFRKTKGELLAAHTELYQLRRHIDQLTAP